MFSATEMHQRIALNHAVLEGGLSLEAVVTQEFTSTLSTAAENAEKLVGVLQERQHQTIQAVECASYVLQSSNPLDKAKADQAQLQQELSSLESSTAQMRKAVALGKAQITAYETAISSLQQTLKHLTEIESHPPLSNNMRTVYTLGAIASRQAGGTYGQ